MAYKTQTQKYKEQKAAQKKLTEQTNTKDRAPQVISYSKFPGLKSFPRDEKAIKKICDEMMDYFYQNPNFIVLESYLAAKGYSYTKIKKLAQTYEYVAETLDYLFTLILGRLKEGVIQEDIPMQYAISQFIIIDKEFKQARIDIVSKAIAASKDQITIVEMPTFESK